MGKSKNSHTVFGTRGNPQGRLSQGNAERKARELAAKSHSKSLANDKFDASKLSYVKSKKKIENYLLNIKHEDGGPKAKFFINELGYSKFNPKEFFDEIQNCINGKIPVKVNHTEYGLKLEFHEKIKGKNGKYINANIVVIVQKDKGKVNYKIVTAYPDDKEK